MLQRTKAALIGGFGSALILASGIAVTAGNRATDVQKNQNATITKFQSDPDRFSCQGKEIKLKPFRYIDLYNGAVATDTFDCKDGRKIIYDLAQQKKTTMYQEVANGVKDTAYSIQSMDEVVKKAIAHISKAIKP